MVTKKVTPATKAKTAPQVRKSRVAFTPSADLAAALDELSRETGRPAASLVADILDDMTAHMRELAKISRQTKAGNAQAARSALSKLLGEMFVDRFIAAESGQKGLDL